MIARKKVLSFILVMAMCFTLISPITASADEENGYNLTIVNNGTGDVPAGAKVGYEVAIGEDTNTYYLEQGEQKVISSIAANTSYKVTCLEYDEGKYEAGITASEKKVGTDTEDLNAAKEVSGAFTPGSRVETQSGYWNGSTWIQTATASAIGSHTTGTVYVVGTEENFTYKLLVKIGETSKKIFGITVYTPVLGNVYINDKDISDFNYKEDHFYKTLEEIRTVYPGYTVEDSSSWQEGKVAACAYIPATTKDVPISVEPGDVTLTFTNTFSQKTGSVEVKKVDDSGNALSGAEFKVYDGTTEIGTLTESNTVTGSYSLNGLLLDKEYTLKETKAPTGYKLSDTAGKTFQIPFTEGASSFVYHFTEAIVNQANSFYFNVKDAVGGNPVAGATFTLGNKTISSDANGLVTFKAVPEGTYTMTQDIAPKGYKKSAIKNWEVKISADGTATIGEYGVTQELFGIPVLYGYINQKAAEQTTIINEAITGAVSLTYAKPIVLGSLSGFIKQLAGDKLAELLEGYMLSTGAEFSLYNADDKTTVIATLTEGENGKYSKKGLLVGKNYILKQTKAPEGCKLDPTEYAINIEENNLDQTISNKTGKFYDVSNLIGLLAGETSPLFINYEFGKADLYLINEETAKNSSITDIANLTNILLGGAEFAVLDKNNNVVKNLTEETAGILGLFSSGHYSCKGLEDGTYSVIQTKASDGFARDLRSYEFTISGEQNNVVISNTEFTKLGYKFFNNDKLKAQFTKVDQNGAPLSDATFYMIERDAVIEMLTELAKGSVKSVKGYDWEELLDQVKDGDMSQIDWNTVGDITREVMKLGDYNLEIPAILKATSDSNGIVTFSNDQNIFKDFELLDKLYASNLNVLGGTMKDLFGDDSFVKILDDYTMKIKLHTKMPAGKYILFESEAPDGYQRNPLVWTVTVGETNNNEIRLGILSDYLVEAINEEYGTDLDEILSTQKNFDEAAASVEEAFDSYSEYTAAVLEVLKGYMCDYSYAEAQKYQTKFEGYLAQYKNLNDTISAFLGEYDAFFHGTLNADYKIYNHKIFGEVVIYASDKDTNAPINGIVYKIYSNKDCGEDSYVGTFTEGQYILKNHYIYTKLEAGTYYVKEDSTPNGYRSTTAAPYELKIEYLGQPIAFSLSYENNYNLNYDLNGGTGTTPAAVVVKVGKTATVDFSQNPTKDDYIFVGWSTEATTTSAIYTATGVTTFVMPAKDVKLYAVWAMNKDMTVTAAGIETTYDGKPHHITVEPSEADCAVTYSLTERGEYTTTNPAITAATTGTSVYYKAEKTGYKPITGSAIVKIAKAPLTITADSASKTYDGTTLTDSGWQDTTPAGLIAGDYILGVEVTGSAINVGTVTNAAINAMIVRKLGDNSSNFYQIEVTSNYDIKYVDGTLTITSSGGSSGGRNHHSKTTTTITDPAVPLAGTPVLNKVDHFNYVKGYEDGNVKAQNNITREEVATIFYRLLTDPSRAIYFSKDEDFSDIASTRWSLDAIATLANGGVLEGYNDGTFGASKAITRAEFAVIASRFDVLEEVQATNFSDTSGHWAEKYINSAAKKGWITGYSDGTFKPDQKITRAEAITLINRVLERRISNTGLIDGYKVFPDNKSTDWYYYDVIEATNNHNYAERKTMSDMETWTKILDDKTWTE